MSKDFSDIKGALQRFKDGVKKKTLGNEREQMMSEMTASVMKAFIPVLEQMANNSKTTKQEFMDALKEIKIAAPEVRVPDVYVPEIKIPNINVPTPRVNLQVPKAESMSFPDFMKVFGEVSLKDIDKKTPLPVIMMGPDGKPFMFSQMSGGFGGKADFFTIKDIQTSSGSSVIDNDGFVKVTGNFSVSSSGGSTTAYNAEGVAYNGDNPFPVKVSEVFGTTGANVVNPDNRVKVALDQSAGGGTQYAEGAAASTFTGNIMMFGEVSTDNPKAITSADPLPVTLATQLDQINDSITIYHGSGAIGSTNIAQYGGVSVPTSYEVNAGFMRVVHASDVGMSVNIISSVTQDVRQVSGAINSTNMTQYGGNAVPTGGELNAGFMRVVHATDVAVSTNIVNTNAIEVKQVSGAIDSVIVQGASDSFFAYEVMTTNKTAKSDGADIRPKTDDLGRQVITLHQVRDLISTAYITLTNGTETTLLAAGGAGVFRDLMYVMGANNSDAAVQVDFREVTGGNIVMSLGIPPYSTSGVTLPKPWPQSSQNNNWTADMPDITGTTVALSALFSNEI